MWFVNPVPLDRLGAGIPCQIKLSVIFASAEDRALLAPNTASDDSKRQVAKDLGRDRVVINGRRIVGGEVAPSGGGDALDALLAIAAEAAQAAAVAAGLDDAFSADQCRHLAWRALKDSSRTNSAFICHTSLHKIIDLSAVPDTLIVPESTLAMPLVIRFSAAAPPLPHAPPVLKCDVQAATVYRLCVGEELRTIMQLKVTFRKTLREMKAAVVASSWPATGLTPPPPPPPPLAAAGGRSTGSPAGVYDSEAFIILEKETMSTSRDWSRG